MKILTVRRRTRRISIYNSWAIGSWYELATFVTLHLFGLRIRTLHAYFISYAGHFCDLKDGWKYSKV